MAQTGYTPISIYYSSTASAVPTAGNLVAGELAINTADGRLFYKDSAGVVQVIAGKGGSGVAGGSTTQVQYNSSGSLAGSANMTFSGTALTLANDASISGLTVGKGASAVSTNSVLGYQAGQAVTSGGQLVAIGYQSAYSNTTGGDNVAIGGYQALYSNTSGSQNIAIGRSALTANTTGGSNVGIGYQTLYSNTTASNNTAVGYQAGYSTTTGSNNVIMGNTAGYTNSTGQYNTYIGDRAGYSANYAGASVNTFIGNYSGYSVTSGIANTFVGSGPSFSAGSAITTGSKNTIIGAYSGNNGGLDIRTASNYIVLSDGDGNPRGVFNNSGYFGVGTVAPVGMIHGESSDITTIGYFRNNNTGNTNDVVQIRAERNTTNGSYRALTYYNGGSGAYRFWVLDSGNVQNTNNSYGAISDIKLKENIVDATPKLDKLMQVKVRNYNLKTDQTHKQIGVIAQELEEVFPSLIEEFADKDGDGNDLGTTTKAVKYSVFVPMLIKAVQELKAEVDSLKQQLGK